MTDFMELAERLERNSKQTITRYCGDLNGAIVPHDLLTEAAACIREMVEWRPIETAPRDGTEVIAMIARKRIRLAWYFKPSSRTEGWLDENGRSIKPTHWLPLPPEPGAEA
ncbi:hypothetical protein V8F63_09505 [Brevundimonas sp. LF-1]|uniref:hypothetical protein n=1 Tax=Brevundimonas sp. LF-1 TaxID=3126100 RepID=UPI0030E1B467